MQLSILAHIELKNLWKAWCGSRNSSVCPNSEIYHAEEYFNLLTSPHKELIWFEHSGQSPWVNESAKFIDVMVNEVLMHIPATQ
ncbi:hypothetical protein [Pseudanabaena sp. lw0831]|uniref:hypothetical protein n=1 Tax=Pseudanabaena sp. lw0831 TaxID=1357935 RepID=UPI001915943B|nr:hypothetical protein [Pseudanabaena sp. lw0831]